MGSSLGADGGGPAVKKERMTSGGRRLPIERNGKGEQSGWCSST